MRKIESSYFDVHLIKQFEKHCQIYPLNSLRMSLKNVVKLKGKKYALSLVKYFLSK